MGGGGEREGNKRREGGREREEGGRHQRVISLFLGRLLIMLK